MIRGIYDLPILISHRDNGRLSVSKKHDELKMAESTDARPVPRSTFPSVFPLGLNANTCDGHWLPRFCTLSGSFSSFSLMEWGIDSAKLPTLPLTLSHMSLPPSQEW